jgi:hypothetical protein
MKRIILMAALVAGVVTTQAQTSFGIHAAGILANTEQKESGVTIKGDSKFGWKIGGVANVPVASAISFMPQLNVLTKGSKYEVSESGFTFKQTANLTYVELPLNFVYNSGGFFAGIGPSIGFGIGGKIKVEETGEPDVEADVKFDGKKDATDGKAHLKALDFGGQVIAGYKLPSGLFFNLHYNHGFSNISPESDSEMKNKYFGFGVGFFFGGGGEAKK